MMRNASAAPALLPCGGAPWPLWNEEADNQEMQHTPNQLNQYFADCLSGRYDNLPEPKPEIAISDDHEQIIKIARPEGGYNLYRRKPGSEWEDAGQLSVDGAA